MRLTRKSDMTYETTIVVVMFVAALVVGGVVIAVSGESVAGAYKALWEGAFVGKYNLANTLSKATPLIISGLAAAVATHSGLVNLGLQGQFLMGAFAAALVGFGLQLPAVVHVPLTLLAAIVGGMLWAWPVSYMKSRFRVDEVISTIMLNYIALLFTNYLINYPFKDVGTLARTPRIAETAELARLIPGTTFNSGIFIAVASVILVYLLLWRTRTGYNLRLVGKQPEVGRYAGVNVVRYQALGFLISGAMAGLAGAIPVMGIFRRFTDGIDIGYGLEGLTVSLLGRSNPVGVAIISLLFGAMRSGSMVMERTTTVSREIVDILQAVLIFFVASDSAFKGLIRRKEER